MDFSHLACTLGGLILGLAIAAAQREIEARKPPE